MVNTRGENPTQNKSHMQIIKQALLPGLLSTLFLSSCSTSRTIKGTFQLIDSDISRNGSICKGTGGYSDIEKGLKVVVKNEKSEIIGISALGPDSYKGEYSSVTCSFPFVVEGLPNAKFYSIEVGRRGSLTYTPIELKEKDWEVAFSLG